jgi:hypothetical protein
MPASAADEASRASTWHESSSAGYQITMRRQEGEEKEKGKGGDAGTEKMLEKILEKILENKDDENKGILKDEWTGMNGRE